MKRLINQLWGSAPADLCDRLSHPFVSAESGVATVREMAREGRELGNGE